MSIGLSKVYVEDLVHIIVKDILEVEQRIVRVGISKLMDVTITKIKGIENRLSRIENIVEQTKIAVSEHKDFTLQCIRKLFCTRRCNLRELTMAFPRNADKSTRQDFLYLYQLY